MCADARTPARLLGLEADHYVHAEVDGVLEYANWHDLRCDGLVSNDTIEHVYRIVEFLRKAGNVTDGDLSLMLATAANPRNPKVARALARRQSHMEHEGTVRRESEDPRDTAQAYLPLRREMTGQHARNVHGVSEVPTNELETLARNTRGMRMEDFTLVVETYVATRTLPEEVWHPPNTCDPLSGNLCERMLDPRYIGRILQSEGCAVRFVAGYYGSGAAGSSVKKLARIRANAVISWTGSSGLCAASFCCVSATHDQRRERYR